MTLSNIANAENALYQHYSALMFLQNHLVLESCIPNQLGANHVCVRLSCRRDIITSMWYFEIMEWYKVSLLHDSITETWYFTNFKHSKLQKQFEMEYTLLQGSKECTSARYFFLCLKLASNEVSCLCDSITQTWFAPNCNKVQDSFWDHHHNSQTSSRSISVRPCLYPYPCPHHNPFYLWRLSRRTWNKNISKSYPFLHGILPLVMVGVVSKAKSNSAQLTLTGAELDNNNCLL